MTPPTFLLIEGGELFAPEPRGPQSILVAGDRIAKIGEVDKGALDRLGVPWERVDARGGVVVPGFIDPHQHLLGGSGEGGPSLQSPMLMITEIARTGITSVVGLLGVDTTMRTPAGLLARVKGLAEEGLSTYMWSGGYNVPPTTLLSSIRDDIMFVDEVIGAGEIAISDERGLGQGAQELAKLVRDAAAGGLLSAKAGVTHFHVGSEPTCLQPLRDIVEQFHVKTEWLYPTHVARNEGLLEEAADLARKGATVDIDTTEGELVRWVSYYLGCDGPIDRLTISSDADSGSPDLYAAEWRSLVLDGVLTLEDALGLTTTNVARVLKLGRKGRLQEGCDGDVVVLERDSLRVREVIACGKRLVADGEPVVRERFLEQSGRRWTLKGDQPSEEPAQQGGDH